MEEFCEKVVEKGEYPRLQVTQKDGKYFTLNNTRLHLFKRLQEMGYCSKVYVEKIPLCDIPCGIRDMMTVSVEATFKPKRKVKRRGYCQIHQKENEKSDSESSTDEENEDETGSDSEFDDTTEEEEEEEYDDEIYPENLEEPTNVTEEESLL
ncbi:hypothetical protein LOTGIDRAFT_170609 [Lottia gigantea]|uniref:Uncharacterized protein n=1 Tax=Lottia gigantea TaxID=225164 RepID=V4CQA2_LOTGI|nr:hypothetical protein LOTGIDRAFT_170609 [Lottia gigantea]ESP04640.1 hypothetical protein LOTGIDRAFT_170609 [Lottia gigantea]